MPGQMSAAPDGHVIVERGPYDEVEVGGGGVGVVVGAVPPIEHCLTVPGAGSPNTAFVQAVPPETDL